MTLKAKRVTWQRRMVLPQGSQGPDGAFPPTTPHHPSWSRRPRAATTGVRNARDDPRVIVPARRLLSRRPIGMPSSGAVKGAPSRGGRSHPPARAPCRPPRPPCAGALRGGVKAPPVGVARRRRAAAAAVPAAAPFSPPHVSPATATWLYVPPCALAAVESASVPGVDASPSAPPL